MSCHVHASRGYHPYLFPSIPHPTSSLCHLLALYPEAAPGMEQDPSSKAATYALAPLLALYPADVRLADCVPRHHVLVHALGHASLLAFR